MITEMNLTIVTDTYPPDVNGAALTLQRLTRSMLQLGHTVNVIHTGEASTDYETSVSGFRFPFYKDVKIGYPRPLKLRGIWKKQRPDIIYVATEGFLGVSAMLTARHLDIPVVAGFHTNFHQYLKRYFIPQIERPVLGILRAIHNYCDATIVPSQHTYDLLHAQEFRNLNVIGRGVNKERFHPEKRSSELRASWGVNEEDCVIIIVGRIAKEKNLVVALETIANLDTTRNIKTVIVGEGPLRKSLEAKYSSDDYHWAGLLKGEELAEHYASADVMFFTSETETFGNVITESLASGLISVAYSYAAAGDLITDGENGFTAPPADIAKLTSKLITAIENKDNVTMRSLARQSALQYTWTDIAQKFVNTLERTITQVRSL